MEKDIRLLKQKYRKMISFMYLGNHFFSFFINIAVSAWLFKAGKDIIGLGGSHGWIFFSIHRTSCQQPFLYPLL